MADSGQRTEEPTPKRLLKARQEGQFPAAREFVSAIPFLVFVMFLAVHGAGWLQEFRQDLRRTIDAAFHPDASPAQIVDIARFLLIAILRRLAPCGALMLLATLVAQLIVTRLGMSLKKLVPEWKRINPINRLKELPRQNITALLRALIMLPVFGLAVYGVIRDTLASDLVLAFGTVESGFRQACRSLATLLSRGALVFLALGVVDLFRQTRRFRRDLRMSKQEIREEVKEAEGNPQMKARIRRLQRDRSRRRMMKEVPSATAVIVNPTHYAIALKYALDSMAAPVVVAKGKNYLAQRIRQRAIENQVPIIENPPLAQALYRSVEVGQEIPAHLYRAVAEILAYIFRLMNGRLPG
ncbi:MAG: EscU/YscU/HrcU family type III secretion system export apparatus switch protein [Bryobacteraceae bacterium]